MRFFRQQDEIVRSRPAIGRWDRSRAVTALGVLIGGIVLVASLLMVESTRAGAIRHAPNPISVSAPRVVILKKARVLHLLDGNRLVRTYPVDLGTAPDGTKRRKGDGRTPIGSFRVVSKNSQSPYHRFIGIDYPSLDAAQWGLARGLISAGEAASIRSALATGRCPDWSTELGGGIGIHGRRIGRDWTGGCIALTDEHVEELFGVIRIGDPIEILP